MESKRPTRRPPATPLRNYSSPGAAQLSNEPINRNRTRHEYDQPPANKTPPALRGMQSEGSSRRAPTARTARGPQPPRSPGPSRLRPGPADSERPSAAPERRRREKKEEEEEGKRRRRRRRVRREEGDAKVEAQPRVAALRAMPAAAHSRSRQRPCPGALPSSPPHRFRVTGAGPQVPAGTRRGPGPAHAAPPAAARGCPLGLRRAARQVRGEGRGATGEEVRGSP